MAEPGALRAFVTLTRQTRYKPPSRRLFVHGKRLSNVPNQSTRRIATSAVSPSEDRYVFPPGPSTERQEDEHRSHVPPVQRRSDRLERAKPFSDFLTDTHQRQHDYLRISVTERCNLRCVYCMPEEGVNLSPPSHLLTAQEIFYLSSLFVSQGVTKIRLTGGEPTVRKDILPIMRSIGSLRPHGLRELCLTTNGISLHRKLDSMVETGLTGVNLSLDTLDPFQFQIMTRRKGFEAVMKTIERILELNRLGAGIKLKINCVVMRGVNDNQIVPFLELGREKDIEVRFIEYMPFDGNRWTQKKMLGYQEMLETIRQTYPHIQKVQDHKNDTSKTFQVPGFEGKFGFITSMTHNFCGTCNRLRITSDGNLKVCLFGNSEVSLRDLLREQNDGSPIDGEAFEALKRLEMDRRQAPPGSREALGFSSAEQQLLNVIGAAVKRKKAKHAGMGELENMKNRPMILIGGYVNPTSMGVLALMSIDEVRLGRPWGNMAPLRLSRNTRRGDSSHRFFSTSARRGKLPHLTPSSEAHMVRVTNKPPTHRVAVAEGQVHFTNATPLELIRTSALQKGDVLAVARVAGIMAAKRTSELIPLCHPLSISGVEVDLDLQSDAGQYGVVVIKAQVECVGPTGVEMEALTAVMGAALTVVDMCKAVDRGMILQGVRVVHKSGGRSGEYTAPKT